MPKNNRHKTIAGILYYVSLLHKQGKLEK